jgi:hypothetical protein
LLVRMPAYLTNDYHVPTCIINSYRQWSIRHLTIQCDGYTRQLILQVICATKIIILHGYTSMV